AEAWKDQKPPLAPPPSQEILELILASRRRATRLQHWALFGSVLAAASLGTLAVASWVQRNFALDQQRFAIEQRDAALRNASLMRASQSKIALESGDAVSAMLIALDGLPDRDSPNALARLRPETPEAREALLQAQAQLRETSVFEKGDIRAVAFSPDDMRLLL